MLKWTRDGSGVLFHDRMDLYVVPLDGSRLQRIVTGALSRNFSSSDFAGIYTDESPVAHRIAYSRCLYPDSEHDHNDYEIETSNLDGTGKQKLTDNEVFDHYPVWSPNGSRIAFISNRGAEDPDNFYEEPMGGLFTMAEDGSDVLSLTPSIPVTNVGVARHPPAWSPDGQSIAFVVNEGKFDDYPYEQAVYVVGADGSNLTRISGTLSAPAWSRDGKRIAFARPDGDGVSLFTAAPDGSEFRRLTFISGPTKYPYQYSSEVPWVDRVLWSPDGARILYACETVCVVDVDNPPAVSSPMELPAHVDMGEFQSIPVWSPTDRGSPYGDQMKRLASSLYAMASDGTDIDVLVRREFNLVAENSGWRDVDADVASCSEGFVVPNPNENSGLVKNCETLIRVGDGLTGVRGGRHLYLNWTRDTPMDQWDGVTIRPVEATPGPSALRVVALDLGREYRSGNAGGRYRILGGIIPPELGNLDELRVLELDENNLVGSIPSSLGRLTNLRELRLEWNRLSGIQRGLGRLRNLQVLSLSGNDLRGTILDVVGHYDWARAPEPPDRFRNLSELAMYYIKNTPVVSSLTKLEFLYLAYNDLTGSIPAELGSLTNLRALALGYNQ